MRFFKASKERQVWYPREKKLKKDKYGMLWELRSIVVAYAQWVRGLSKRKKTVNGTNRENEKKMKKKN